MTILALVRTTGGSYEGALLEGLNREVGAAGGRVVVVQTIDPGQSADQMNRAPDFDLPVAWDQVDGVVTLALGTVPTAPGGGCSAEAWGWPTSTAERRSRSSCGSARSTTP